MPSVSLAAPAKLNLGLRIVGRRDDGYHLLESLFVPLELADDLEVSAEVGVPGEGQSVVLQVDPAGSDAPTDDRNLAVVAARAYLGTTEAAVRIRLHKRIPTAAGLGGGSSDAAAVLSALAKLLPGDRPLGEIALRIGADVPFFLEPGPALVEGIGERQKPVQGLRPLWVALANPGTPVSTAEVFRLYDGLTLGAGAGLTPSGPRSTMRALFEPGAVSGAPPGFTNDLANDLEAAAIRLCPPIARLRDRMRERGPLVVGMSGSGATVYGIFETESDAQKALEGAGLEAPIWTCLTRLQTSTTRGTRKKR